MKITDINFEKYKFQKDGRVWSVSRECYKKPQVVRGGYLGSTFVCKGKFKTANGYTWKYK